MKKNFTLFMALFLTVTLFAQENLLGTKNPSLNAKNSEDLSEGCWWWGTYQTHLGANMVASAPGQEDSYCAKVVVDDANLLDASVFKWGVQHQFIPVTKGKTYTISYWIKSDTDGKVVGVRANFDSDEADGWQGATAKETTIDIADGWVFQEFTVTADVTDQGNDVTSLKILVCGASTLGDFYFDNFSMVESVANAIDDVTSNEVKVSVSPDGSKLVVLGDVQDKYAIYNLSGQMVKAGLISAVNQVVNVGDLNTGAIYLFKIGNDVVKFVK